MILFLLPLKLLFPSPIILLFIVLLVSHDQLCHAKKMTFRKLRKNWSWVFAADIASSMLCASVQWDNIDALSDCFNKTLTDMLDRFSPLKTRTMISSHGLMMTLNNSSVNVVALKREPWKLTSLVTGIITVKFVISTLHFLNLHVWIIVQT